MEGMQVTVLVTITQQHFIGDGEQRSFERGEHAELIIWPFDSRKSDAQRFHFFAAMKRFRSRDQMRNPPRLERPRIFASQVVSGLSAAPEQNGHIAFAEPPTALFRQPKNVR